MSARVPVHYFEKKKKAVPASERPTEELKRPVGLSRNPSLGDMDPPIATQPTTDPPGSRKRKKKKGASAEQEKVTDPSVKLPLEQLDAWLQDGARGEALKQMSRKQIAELCLFGHHLFESGRMQEAKVVFEGIVGLGVEDAFPHTMLGTIYLAQGEARAALPLFESAIKLDPKDVAAWVYRGEIRLHTGQTRQGLSDLKKAAGMANATDPFVARARKLIDRAGGRRARR
jgi:tetratricopeptide (TPR) repeat protein